MNKRFALLLAALLPLAAQAATTQQPIAIAIHGGAGTIERANFTPEREKAYRQQLKEAVEAGYQILANGGSSLDAVNKAINIMENSPKFNAGIGAVYTFDGGHALDASIMLGKTHEAGAVAGVRHISNPIDLARKVMERSAHVMLSGQGAEEFALEQGMKLVPGDYFDTPARYEALKKAKHKLQQTKKEGKDYQGSFNSLNVDYKFGTVGAVAVDRNGDLVAGTSTGGMTAKRYDRIGDSPVIGAGTWADNDSCAVSATGHGEYFIRYHVAADICSQVKYQGKTVGEAAEAVIFGPMHKAGGTGGVIVLDRQGNISLTFNTAGMYRASRREGEETYVGIYKE